jgi:hypothetical protein
MDLSLSIVARDANQGLSPGLGLDGLPRPPPPKAKKHKKAVLFFEVEILDAKTREKLCFLDKVGPWLRWAGPTPSFRGHRGAPPPFGVEREAVAPGCGPCGFLAGRSHWALQDLRVWEGGGGLRPALRGEGDLDPTEGLHPRGGRVGAERRGREAVTVGHG